MKRFTIDYINENASETGILELDNGDYYTVAWLEVEQVWVYGSTCNVGLLASGYLDAEYHGKEQGLQELYADLEEIERGGIVSGDLIQYSEA